MSSTPTSAGFVSVSGNTAAVSLTSEANDTVSDATVGLVAFASGTNTTRGTVNAVSGIRSGANVGPAVTTGTAVYNARYQHHVIDGAFRTAATINGTRAISTENAIALTADFDAGTLTGFDSDRDFFGDGTDITVNGTISGTTLDGNVRVDHDFTGLSAGSVNADLQGQIGATGVIGAYAGKDNNTVVAGGFVGRP